MFKKISITLHITNSDYFNNFLESLQLKHIVFKLFI